MKKSRFALCVCVGSLSFNIILAGCQSPSAETPVARVGNSVLTPTELRYSIRHSTPAESVAAASIYLEDWQNAAALYEQALSEEQDKDTLTSVMLEKSRRQIIVQRYIERKLESQVFGNDSAEVRKYFDAHAAEFRHPETAYKLIRLYATGADTASLLRGLLRDTTSSLKQLAEKVDSLAPSMSARNRREVMLGNTYRAANALGFETGTLRDIAGKMLPADISPVVRIEESVSESPGKASYIVIRLNARVKSGDRKNFEEAFDEARERLRLEKQRTLYNSLVSTAKALQRPK